MMKQRQLYLIRLGGIFGSRTQVCLAGFAAAVALFVAAPKMDAANAGSEQPPNVLWIVIEDISRHLSSYGERTIETPNIDGLAEEGVLFENAYATAPVCSPARSAMITGMYQTTIGAHHHRSGRGEKKIHLPEHVELLPAIMREAGYWTGNGRWPSEPGQPLGKTDYNFEWDSSIYDDSDWSGRAEGQPFFHQIQLEGGKLRDVPAWLEMVYDHIKDPTPPDAVTLPPYYPEHPDILRDWAEYLDSVRYTDYEVGQIVKRLEDEGILDETVIFLISDHGISHVRGKQFLYEEGAAIPMIVHGPGIETGQRREDLALQIDLAASTLALAGVEIPAYMQGVDLFADDYTPREWIALARDRCDESVDAIRGIRGERFKYLRNMYPRRPYLVPNVYKDNKVTVRTMRKLYPEGKLNAAQISIMAPIRPAEELYDLSEDPHELHNLAGDPEYADVLAEYRKILDRWIVTSGDQGEESAAMYDSDMEVYLNVRKRRAPERAENTRENIKLMKLWDAQDRQD